MKGLNDFQFIPYEPFEVKFVLRRRSGHAPDDDRPPLQPMRCRPG
jgi:hypothetical protein